MTENNELLHLYMGDALSLNDIKDKLKNFDLIGITTFWKEVLVNKAAIETSDKRINELSEFMRLSLIPEIVENSGLETPIKVAGVGRISVTNDMYVSTVAGAKDDLIAWLWNNGYEDLVKPSVNPSTLKSFVKECIETGTTYPVDVIKVTPYQRASLLK